MYLSNNHKDGLRNPAHRLPATAVSRVGNKQTVFESLTGEEKPFSIAGLLVILVSLLHLWGGLYLLQPVKPITPAQPLMMEVSLLSAPGQQPTTAPLAPPKAVEPPVKPKVQPVKKPLKKNKPAKQAKLPKPVTTSDAMLPAPSLTDEFASASETRSDAAPAANTTKSANGTQGNAVPYSEASFNANYGTNPKPKYPAFARSRGWQGKVLLRVKVNAEGLSEAVTVHHNSGHEILDESAIAAVEKWQFIPARRGDTAVACTVIVPIIFTLNTH